MSDRNLLKFSVRALTLFMHTPLSNEQVGVIWYGAFCLTQVNPMNNAVSQAAGHPPYRTARHGGVSLYDSLSRASGMFIRSTLVRAESFYTVMQKLTALC